LKAIGLDRESIGKVDWDVVIEEAAAQKSWLVVFTHEVEENASGYGCHPKDLDFLLRRVRRYDLDILPISQVLAEATNISALT
jgi:hypothetical protein